MSKTTKGLKVSIRKTKKIEKGKKSRKNKRMKPKKIKVRGGENIIVDRFVDTIKYTDIIINHITNITNLIWPNNFCNNISFYFNREDKDCTNEKRISCYLNEIKQSHFAINNMLTSNIITSNIQKDLCKELIKNLNTISNKIGYFIRQMKSINPQNECNSNFDKSGINQIIVLLETRKNEVNNIMVDYEDLLGYQPQLLRRNKRS